MINRRSENKEKKVKFEKKIKTSPVKFGSGLIQDEG